MSIYTKRWIICRWKQLYAMNIDPICSLLTTNIASSWIFLFDTLIYKYIHIHCVQPIQAAYKNVNLIIYLCFNMYSALRIDFVFTLLMTYNKTLLNEYSYRWMWTLWMYSVIYTIKYRVLDKRKYSTLITHSSIVALPFALTNSPTNIIRTLALKYIFVLCIICTAFFGTLFTSRDDACLSAAKDYWGRDERSLRQLASACRCFVRNCFINRI